MESHLLPFCRTLFAIFLLGLLARRHVEATEYTVGEEDEWDTGTNYFLWSQKYNFSVGDVLVFKYAIGQHDACQVTEETFRSCDSTSGVVRTYSSGLDRVKLTEAGKYWFICSVKGHCQAGMRFGLSVASASPDGGIDGALPPGGDGGLAPPPPEQGSTGAAGEGVGRWKIGWVLGLAVGGLFLLNC